jgi:hypothetical protein
MLKRSLIPPAEGETQLSELASAIQIVQELSHHKSLLFHFPVGQRKALGSSCVSEARSHLLALGTILCR